MRCSGYGSFGGRRGDGWEKGGKEIAHPWDTTRAVGFKQAQRPPHCAALNHHMPGYNDCFYQYVRITYVEFPRNRRTLADIIPQPFPLCVDVHKQVFPSTSKSTAQCRTHTKQQYSLYSPVGWDIGERQEMVTLKGHSDIVMGMMVMSSLDNLVSASLDTSIRVWDTYTQKPVHTLLGHNKVRLYAGKTEGPNRGACTLYTRRLTTNLSDGRCTCSRQRKSSIAKERRCGWRCYVI